MHSGNASNQKSRAPPGAPARGSPRGFYNDMHYAWYIVGPRAAASRIEYCVQRYRYAYATLPRVSAPAS